MGGAVTAQNKLKMYDLAAADASLRFSPYCWRVRMALAHKGLEVETIPWRFSDKAAIAPSGQGRVPVLIDRPSIFGGVTGRALSRFYVGWADGVLNPSLVRFLVLDIWKQVDPKDKDYFRKTREERVGATLETFVVERDKYLKGFRDSLLPLRLALKTQPFLGGDKPLQADYIVFGGFQWARKISDFELLAADDPVAAWRGRMLDLFNGIAK